jgi:hypothetical protein
VTLACQPAQEAGIVVAVVGRHAAVIERAGEPHPVYPVAGVPGVADAVVIAVAEVVGLPGVRRHHQGHAGAIARRRTQHERCERPLTVGAAQRGEVQPTRPASDPHRHLAPAPPGRPHDLHGRDGCPLHHVVRPRRLALAPGAQHLDRDRPGGA